MVLESCMKGHGEERQPEGRLRWRGAFSVTCLQSPHPESP